MENKNNKVSFDNINLLKSFIKEGKFSALTGSIKNLKVKIGDDEYTAFGTYKVPNNTKVSISWSYCETYYHINSWKNVWNNASVDLMVGEIEHVTVTLVEGSAKIDKEWGI